MIRRRRVIRAVESITRDERSPDSIETGETEDSFSSLGTGDQPRRFDVNGLHDISKQTSILVEFLSQDFAEADISDYQPTFVDDYASITRILGREFGRGFPEDVYHYRDAPFVERSYEGIPRSITAVEKLVLEQHGSFMLPSPSITDAFITAFFDRVFPTMPIMDRATFTKNFYGMRGSTRKPSLLLIQSVMLAGSTVYDHPDVQLMADEVSSRLHARAKALIDTKFEQDRLVLVQAHLLISSFTADSCDDTIHNMWLSLGAAVRIAQGIGMHRDLGRAKASAIMRRQWKRLWWTLFIHDTICSFEWGRPRAIQLADTDVPLPTEADFSPDEPGGLPLTEHVQFFLALCKLCFIIVDWLELLRPGRMSWGHGSSSPYADQALTVSIALETWLAELPAVMQPPRELQGFSLWTGTLHILYHSVILRFYASLSGPSAAEHVHNAAVKILGIGKDLSSQGLLGSLWGFGIHQFDLAMGQHARETKSDDKETAANALSNLRQGIPFMQLLCQRSSTAAQGLAFYEALLEKQGDAESQVRGTDIEEMEPCSDWPRLSSQANSTWYNHVGGSDLADLDFLDWNAPWTR
ncbi:hypothetical protein B7463_g2470 [Neofusicoccum parvum]|nr:hypothetical protein B7463_g2470 [Neofusicoccum parvum]